MVFPLFFSISCKPDEELRQTVAEGVLSPRAETQAVISNQDESTTYANHDENLMLINLGNKYNIIALADGNLDSDHSDEQVLIVLPLDEPSANLELIIASATPARQQYGIIRKFQLQTRVLTGITLNLDDITGDGRNELILSGFDEENFYITKIYSVPQGNRINDITMIFEAKINGNIDILLGTKRVGESIPASIVVQEIDAKNKLDLIETIWTWDPSSYTFKSGTPRRVEINSILEERMKNVYTGNVDKYEEYLSGPWYRKNGSEASLDYVFFDPEKDEILFHSGSIQEAYKWEVSRRTTAKRLYNRLRNEIVPSIVIILSINAESWDEIEIISNTDWTGDYHRLSPSLQKTLNIEETSLSSMLRGTWQNQSGSEIMFDLPRIQWSENGNVRAGIASLFILNDELVLQIQFIKENGAVEEAVNWLVEYDELVDPVRKSIFLTRAQLDVRGTSASNLDPMRFEQYP